MNLIVSPVTALLALATLAHSAQANVRVQVTQANVYDIEQGQGRVQLSLPAIPLSSGAGRASADELRGQLRTFAQDFYGDSTAAEARLSDELQFTVTQSGSVTAYLHTWLTGQLTVEQGASAGGGIELLSIHRADNQYRYRNSYLQNYDCASGQPAWVSCTAGFAIDERVSLAIPLLPGAQSVFIQAELQGFAYRAASADFGNSAYIWLEVPEGVTWTSSAPGFLSLAGPVPAPVPEPTTAALCAVGLAGLMWRARRRRALASTV